METKKKRIGIYPGSFDPLTNGHLDIIIRASRLFDSLIVGVLRNDAKKTLFSMEERVALIRKCTEDIPNVSVEMFEGLLVDFVHEKKADAIVRGLRAVSDYEYELQMAMLNKHMSPDVETIFLMTDINNSYLSSSVVKDVAMHGGNIKGLVPETVIDDIYRKVKAK
ncbi:MAG: pantetheine-phosphate adenylyltransferase [Clostridia bacterium]|nr:pantetheine-phosphate adenylyltransferase [Clostridia bacterium]MCR5056341.1 pantetheine-phosphate adenylyltransferase [Clostridia bacterium]